MPVLCSFAGVPEAMQVHVYRGLQSKESLMMCVVLRLTQHLVSGEEDLAIGAV